MQISLIYLYIKLTIMKQEFRQVLEKKQSHYVVVQHLLHSLPFLSIIEGEEKQAFRMCQFNF